MHGSCRRARRRRVASRRVARSHELMLTLVVDERGPPPPDVLRRTVSPFDVDPSPTTRPLATSRTQGRHGATPGRCSSTVPTADAVTDLADVGGVYSIRHVGDCVWWFGTESTTSSPALTGQPGFAMSQRAHGRHQIDRNAPIVPLATSSTEAASRSSTTSKWPLVLSDNAASGNAFGDSVLTRIAGRRVRCEPEPSASHTPSSDLTARVAGGRPGRPRIGLGRDRSGRPRRWPTSAMASHLLDEPGVGVGTVRRVDVHDGALRRQGSRTHRSGPGPGDSLPESLSPDP